MDNQKITVKEQIFNLFFLIKILFKTNKRIFFIRLPMLFLQTISSILSIWFMRLILNEISTGADVKKVVLFSGLMAGSALLVNTLSKIVSIFDSREMQRTENRLRLFLADIIMNLPYRYAVDPETLNFLELAKKENSFSTVLSAVTNVLGAVINALTYATVVLTVNPLILLLIAANSAIDMLLLRKTAKLAIENENEVFPVYRKLWAQVGILFKLKFGKEMRINRLQDWTIEKGRKQNDYALSFEKSEAKSSAELSGLQDLAGTVLNVCVYLILAFLMLFRSLLIGDFTYVLNCTLSLSGSIKGLISGWNDLLNHGLFSRGFKYCFDLAELHRDDCNCGDENIMVEDTSIEFRNVTFTYPYSDSPVLKHISFKIESGETLSLVGVNGSGKTTLVMLLCRFYEPDEGEILLGGIPINRIQVEKYHRILGVAFQNSQIFAGTIKENIAYSNDIKKERIKYSLDISALFDKISSLPQTYDTVIGRTFDENGTDFSGGEKQKLAIARAIVSDPKVMIFDEPTAALDPIAEHEIITSLRRAIGGRTAIFISHRLSFARTSDKIAVLSGGVICEFGTHSELMEIENGVYRELFTAQAKYYVGINLS